MDAFTVWFIVGLGSFVGGWLLAWTLFNHTAAEQNSH